MKQVLGFLLMVVTVSKIHAQIVIQAEEKPPVKNEKSKSEVEGTSAVRFGTNWSYTMRKLTENEAPYGDSLGNRATETNLNCWSFGLGISNKLTSYLRWTGSIAYLKNGENYSFTDAMLDSTFRSSTTYSYLALPLQLDVTIGNQLVFYAGFGIIPQILSRYRQERFWKVGNSSEQEELWKVKPDYGPNMFVLSLASHIGLQLNMEDAWAIFVEPQIRFQLSSTYQTQDSYIHKNRSYGFNMGILRHL